MIADTLPADQKLQAIRDVLRHLIAFARSATERPLPSPADELEELVNDVRDAGRLLIEGGNPVGEAPGMLVRALRAFDRHRRLRSPQAGQWKMIVGALLPMVEDTLAGAMQPRAGEAG